MARQAENMWPCMYAGPRTLAMLPTNIGCRSENCFSVMDTLMMDTLLNRSEIAFPTAWFRFAADVLNVPAEAVVPPGRDTKSETTRATSTARSTTQPQLIWRQGGWYEKVRRGDGKQQGQARTQAPTLKNYDVELPTFGVILGVSSTEVQWKSLALGERP